MSRNLVLLALLSGVAVLATLPATAADLNSEINNAAVHAGLAAQAADIATVHTHLHHTVNCLVGPGGAGFNPNELNPCANAGNGAIPDSTNASTKQALEAALAEANSGLASSDLATAQKAASQTGSMLKAVK